MDIIATLNGKTVAELRSIAAQRDIAGRSTMKKAELVQALYAADVELLLAIDEITPEQEARFAEQYNAAKAAADAEAGELLDAVLGAEVDNDATYIEEGLEQDAEAGTYSFTNEVAILRDAPGRAIVTAAFDGRTVGGSIVRIGRRYMLTAGSVRVTGNTFEKVAKLFAKRLGFRADVIDIDRTV
jgi:hypothetical protein